MVSTGEAAGELLFACPQCGSSLFVNQPMRDTLLEEGCVLCGSELSDDDFDSVE